MNAPLLSKWLLLTHLVSSTTALTTNNSTWLLSRPSTNLQALLEGFRQTYPQISRGEPSVWEMVQIAALCSLLPGLFYLRRTRKDSKSLSLASTEYSNNGMCVEQEGSDSNGKSSLDILRTVADNNMYRCWIYRPRAFEEAFRDQVIRNEPLHIPKGPSLLSSPPTSG